jgi:hypothetical protein
MAKVLEDGYVAVLYSPGFGAGWHTWNQDRAECVFDPEIVQLVRRDASSEEIETLAREKWAQGDDHFFPGGADQLRIEWIREGARFRIDEYDGSERVVTEEDQEWLTA